MTHPLDITDSLVTARAEFMRVDSPMEKRMDACRTIRHKILALDLEIDPELWERRYLIQVLQEAELCLQDMENQRGIVEKEALQNHKAGTTANNLISFCRNHIFSMRQRSEIFAEPKAL